MRTLVQLMSYTMLCLIVWELGDIAADLHHIAQVLK